MNALHVAAKLIALGLAPLPLASPDDPRELSKPIDKRGKAPFEKGWQGSRSADGRAFTPKPCPRSLEDLPALRPEHNVGIRTGRVPGARYQVVVVDIDSQNAFFWAQSALPPTNVVTLTGRVEAGWRGQHWYYLRSATDAGIRFPNKAGVRWRDEFHDGQIVTLKIDVKADEGQVVAPGSRHGTGGVYEEAAPWTEDLLAAMPTLDMTLFEPIVNGAAATAAEAACEEAAEAATERGETARRRETGTRSDAEDIGDDPTRGVSTAERTRRFAAYLRRCDPSYPGISGGAGAHCLGIARAGCWGLVLPPDVAAATMLRGEWNSRCHDGAGNSYPWSLDELLHKCRDANRPASSDGSMRRPRGYMLDENNENNARRNNAERRDDERTERAGHSGTVGEDSSRGAPVDGNDDAPRETGSRARSRAES
jgi:hypothetical protein